MVERLLTAGSAPRTCAVAHLVYVGGLRPSEVSGLVWGDLRPTPDGGGEVAVRGRDGGRRMVRLPPGSWHAVMALGPSSPATAVVRSRTGGPIDRRRIWWLVRELAGGEDPGLAVAPRDLRRSRALHRLQDGAPLDEVRRGLGHASLRTTRKYLDLRPDT